MINTPLKADAWQRYLANHPDLAYVDYILDGIRNGFRIGFNATQPLTSSNKNMRSAQDHPEVVEKQLLSDCSQGYMLGPFDREQLPPVHTSRIGVIPKKHQPDKWCLIVDLSFPREKSVNDGIAREDCSLTYVKVDAIVDSILNMGRGTLLAKMDVKSAFRNIPVHPADRHLLGIAWRDKLYIDASLPFGLRSAPKIFNAVADALEWISREHGVDNCWHYLDDFIVAGIGQTKECQNSLDTLIRLCEILGVPLAADKIAGPAYILAVLGIEFDTEQLLLRLPPEKLIRLRQMLAEWARKKKCTKRDLKSLVGHLQHAATIIKSGRTFLRRMYNLLPQANLPHHFIRLNEGFKSDLAWWSLFLESWEGSAMMSPSKSPAPTATVTSDASGCWGCGAFCNNDWFQLAWPDEATAQQPITLKELAPLVIAVGIWGSHWKFQVVRCLCDNAAVVSILQARTCKNKEVMHLLRCLYFYEAHFQCKLIAEHIPGTLNDRADDLSRNQLFSFLQKMPHASPSPTPIPSAMLDLLFKVKPDWLAQEWKQLFKDSLAYH